MVLTIEFKHRTNDLIIKTQNMTDAVRLSNFVNIHFLFYLCFSKYIITCDKDVFGIYMKNGRI